MEQTLCVAQLINIKSGEGMVLKIQARVVAAFCRSRIKFCGMGGIPEAGANPVSRSAELGDSALGQYRGCSICGRRLRNTVTTVDACFGIWGAKAGQQQKVT